MLPKLGRIFEITTDELLGVERKPEETAAPLPEPERAGPERWKGNKLGVVTALWLLLNAGIWVINEIDFIAPLNPWTMAVPTALVDTGGNMMMGILVVIIALDLLRASLLGGKSPGGHRPSVPG